MTSIATENLEERIERIRKRTEEIEKKHRAAEEDRLMALMDNAMVKTKPPNDDDWPKAHKYDKLDFTYDIKPEKIEENIEQKQQQLMKPKRDYKKFADGEGPPPDPIYNFLADAERDGIILQQKEQHNNKNIDKKDLKQNQLNNSNGNNGRNIDNKNKDQFNKRGGNGNGQQNSNNNSFRNRGNNNNGNNNSTNNNGKLQQNNRYQKQNSQPEQWRSDKIDDNKLNNRQKMNNIEKWRRSDWDNNDLIKSDKNNLNDLHNNKSPKHNNTNNKNYYQHHNNNQQSQQQNTSNNIYIPIDDIIEKRGNILVSVSPGEVKSVKLTSAQVIGSGRVGPRQLSKPQFHIQSMEKEQQQIIQNVSVHSPPRSQINSGQQQQLNKLNNFNNQQLNNIHNNYQQYATKSSIPPTQNQHQATTSQPQLNLNTNNGICLAPPKSPIKDKRNSKSPKYVSPQQQQQKLILPNLMPIAGSAGDNILKSQTITSPIVVNNMENNLLNNTTANNIGGVGVPQNSAVDITATEIDVKVLAVAKELSNKPEFAKKSVQDRLLRIRQMSQPDVVSSPSLSLNDGDSTSNNNNIIDQLININNNNDNLNATLLIKDANKDEQNDSIKNVETIVACN